jgi:hypothetical protein
MPSILKSALGYWTSSKLSKNELSGKEKMKKNFNKRVTMINK